MPSVTDSPCLTEAAPAEVTVQLRSRSFHPAGRSANRHSYHGTSTTPAVSYQSLVNPLSRFSQLYLSQTPSLSLPQRSSNDWEQVRCAKKRYSANFGASLCPLPEDMNPSEANGRPFVDTMQQGPDLQESPRGSSISSASSKREEPQQPQMMGPGGMPMQGHVLVDPNTGQHYIVPQAAFYQPIQAMQPMYYPPPQPQPMYYPYGQHIPPGYIMPPGAQGQQGPYSMPMQANPGGYVPQNNSRAFASPLASYRSGYGQTTNSNEDVSRRDSEDPLMAPQSPVSTVGHMFPSQMFVPPQTSFAQQYRQQLVSHGSSGNLRSSPNSQPEDPESGFRRDVTRSSAEFAPRSSGEFVRKGSSEFKPRSVENQPPIERTPLYGGPPQWWGREEHESLTDIESRRIRTSPPVAPTASSDTEATRPAPPRAPPAPRSVRMDIDFNKVPEAAKEKAAKASIRSLRMDFDLSKPMPEEEELLKKKAIPKAPATAFTVSFDQPGEGLSLQDAALKSAQVRRVLGRRSGAGPQPSGSQSAPERGPTAPGPAEENTNKKYLLSKLLHGANSNDSGADLPDLDYRKENDVVSEAGTFVVDMSARNAAGGNNGMSRVVEHSDDSTDSETDTDSEDERPPVQQPKVIPPPEPVQEPPKKDNILLELVKLRQMAGIRATQSPSVAAPTVSIRASRQTEAPRPATAAALPPLAKRTSLGSQAQPQPPNRSVLGSASRAPSATSSSNSTNAFRRGDGGRFSMRGGGQAAVPQQQLKRPPFRAGGAAVKSVQNPVQQREQEMNAWLRRKDYNPMKAAAEAKKAKELKARGDQFMSNRSMSFHVGPAAVQPRQNDFRELSRNRSQESIVENEAAEHASQRIVAEYSRGMVKDLNRLSQQSAGSPGKNLSGLARAVDMLSQKCKKSIELIRSQNKGCLSVSVEDLLSAAAEPPRSDETLNDQLERLSDAFDAVQRYLEQYSLDGHQSPIPEFCEEPEVDHHSMISGFSGISFRLSQVPQERSPRAPIASSVAGGSPRTTGYRSRILAANTSYTDTPPHS